MSLIDLNQKPLPLSIHILTTSLNRDRHQSILNTWLKDFYDYVFYTDFTSEIGNQVELTTNTEYHSNGEKHILEVNRIVREKIHNDYQWFYFCDDDTVPNISRILDYCRTADRSKVHAWTDTCWAEDPTLLSVSGGAGYLVPSEVFQGRTPPRLKRIVWSDVQFALWLRENGIPLQHNSEFKHNIPSQFGIDISTVEGRNLVREHMSFHYVKNHELRSAIWELYNTPKD
jgi:hypothetical protein